MLSNRLLNRRGKGLLTQGFRIIRVPFTGSVRLRSVLLKTGPGEQTPKNVQLVRLVLSTVFSKR